MQGANDALVQGRSFYSLSLEFSEDVSAGKVRAATVPRARACKAPPRGDAAP